MNHLSISEVILWFTCGNASYHWQFHGIVKTLKIRSGLLPALFHGCVRRFSFHPAAALVICYFTRKRMLFLPEWRIAFQIIHQEFRSFKRIFTVAACTGNKNDLFTSFNHAGAMVNHYALQWPALRSLLSVEDRTNAPLPRTASPSNDAAIIRAFPISIFCPVYCPIMSSFINRYFNAGILTPHD